MTDVRAIGTTSGPSARERIRSWRSQDRVRVPSSTAGLPPGPRTPLPLQTFRYWSAREKYLPGLHERYGDTFTLRVAPAGCVIVLRNPDHIREIFRGDPDVFHAGEGNALLKPLVGARSVLTLDAPDHKAERRRMMPPFHGERIAAVASLMAEAAEREVAGWPLDREFPLLERTHQLTLDIIVRVVLGVDDAGRAAELGQALRTVLAFPLHQLAMWLWPDLDRFGPWRRAVRDLDRADALIYAEIERRRRDPNRGERPDVLSMLLAGDPDSNLVRDELVTLLVAGHETTAVGLAWTFERLLRHPAALARTRDGLDDPADPYLTAVVKESLRVRPVIFNIARRLTQPVDLAGYHLPAGLLLLPSIGAVHSDPRIWGADVADFRPQRWLESTPPPNHAWLPFGGGTRRCLGAAFAQTEMETVVRTVLQHVDLGADRREDEGTKMHGVTVNPVRGARVRVLRRLR